MKQAKQKKKTTGAGHPPQSKPTVASGAPIPVSTGILIKEVRVRNYRCLRAIDVDLDQLTVLIGQNNSGKTSFLNAFFAAIGAGQRMISNDDVFIRTGEVSAPKDRVLAIDVLIRPTAGDGTVTDVFPQGSPWLELWGSGVVQDEQDHDLLSPA